MGTLSGVDEISQSCRQSIMSPLNLEEDSYHGIAFRHAEKTVFVFAFRRWV
jgi:hypothetical protein